MNYETEFHLLSLLKRHPELAKEVKEHWSRADQAASLVASVKPAAPPSRESGGSDEGWAEEVLARSGLGETAQKRGRAEAAHHRKAIAAIRPVLEKEIGDLKAILKDRLEIAQTLPSSPRFEGLLRDIRTVLGDNDNEGHVAHYPTDPDGCGGFLPEEAQLLILLGQYERLWVVAQDQGPFGYPLRQGGYYGPYVAPPFDVYGAAWRGAAIELAEATEALEKSGDGDGLVASRYQAAEEAEAEARALWAESRGFGPGRYDMSATDIVEGEGRAESS